MNTGLTHVKAGDRLEIRAPVWNKMLDAARDRQAQQHSTGRTPGPDFRGVPILIKNNSGADRSQYEILGVSGVVFAATDDGFKQRIVLTGVTPATGSHEGKFAVLAEPIGDGDIGPAIVDGTTICQINITDADHEYADIADGDAAKLVSAKSGPVQIIWIESGTGTKWAVVRIGPKPPASDGFWARLTSSAADGTNRYKYAFSEVYKSSAGYGGWATLSGGRSGTTSTDPARNTIEDGNSGSGTLGNGVAVSSLDTGDYTFTLQSAPDDVIVWVREVDQGGTTEYWFQYENGIDGSCD